MKITDITTPTIDLHWQGPLSMKPGQVSLGFDDPTFGQDGIYIYSQTHPKGVGIYVGKSDNIRRRIFEHITSFSGGKYWLRDECGEWVYNPQNGMVPKGEQNRTQPKRADDDLPHLIQHNLNILSFIWAAVDADKVSDIEASLIARGMSLHMTAAGFICENGRAESGAPVTIKNDLSAVAHHGLNPALEELLRPAIYPAS